MRLLCSNILSTELLSRSSKRLPNPSPIACAATLHSGTIPEAVHVVFKGPSLVDRSPVSLSTRKSRWLLGTDAWSLLVEWLRQWPDCLWLWRWSRLSQGRMSSLHPIHFDIYHVVSYLPQRLVTMRHHLTVTLCLGEVGGLSPASGEVHEYSIKGNAGTTPDWTEDMVSLESGSGLRTGAFWEEDLWSAWKNKLEVYLINTTASSLTVGLTYCGTSRPPILTYKM